jgi:MFS family permease
LNSESVQKKFWLFVLTGIFLVITTTGFVRMAYGVVLPYMQESLSLSFSEAGMLGTFMFLGYLITVGLSGVLAVRWGAKVVLLAGGWIVIIGLFGLAWASSFWWASVFMFIAGAGSAIVFTPLMSLTIGWFPEKRGAVVGLLLSGAGIGMILSGILVPLVIKLFPEPGWRAAWILFGGISLAVVLVASKVLENPHITNIAGTNQEKPNWFKNKNLIKLAWLYFLVGIAYLIPILYQAVYMIEVGIPKTVAGNVFAFAGIFSIAGAPIWGYISDRMGSKKTLLVVLIWAITGNIIPVLLPNLAGFMISSAIWGTATGGLMALIQVNASQQVPQKYVAAAIGFISIFYAVGQMIGPGLAGWMIEHLGGFSAAYGFGILIYVVGLLLGISLTKDNREPLPAADA